MIIYGDFMPFVHVTMCRMVFLFHNRTLPVSTEVMLPKTLSDKKCAEYIENRFVNILLGLADAYGVSVHGYQSFEVYLTLEFNRGVTAGEVLHFEACPIDFTSFDALNMLARRRLQNMLLDFLKTVRKQKTPGLKVRTGEVIGPVKRQWSCVVAEKSVEGKPGRAQKGNADREVLYQRRVGRHYEYYLEGSYVDCKPSRGLNRVRFREVNNITEAQAKEWVQQHACSETEWMFGADAEIGPTQVLYYDADNGNFCDD